MLLSSWIGVIIHKKGLCYFVSYEVTNIWQLNSYLCNVGNKTKLKPSNFKKPDGPVTQPHTLGDAVLFNF